MNTKPRVIHFVTGGGSGATKVALELACGHLRTGNYEPLLVLRRKKVPLPGPMQAQIKGAGLRTAWVDEGPKWTTRHQLAELIAEFKPRIFAAHGNSEHIWGRQAAFAAGVPVVLHVEQNCERYLFWRRWSAQRLAARTTATICVSQGVLDHVRALGRRDGGVADRCQHIHHPAAVIHVHLAAPGDDVQALGSLDRVVGRRHCRAARGTPR